MTQFIQIESKSARETAACSSPSQSPRMVVWLQSVTLLWMLIECGVSVYGAVSAHSPALLAFGADSFVELLSAAVVLLAIGSSGVLTRDRAARFAGVLLFVLAGVVALVALLALVYGAAPETSCSGIVITLAALVIMPALAWAKRRTARFTNNRALAADAVQSATCAYLAAPTSLRLLWRGLPSTPCGIFIGWIRPQPSSHCPFSSSRDGGRYEARAAAVAESTRVEGCYL